MVFVDVVLVSVAYLAVYGVSDWIAIGIVQVDILVVLYLGWYPSVVLLVGACIAYDYVFLPPGEAFRLCGGAFFLAGGARVVVNLDRCL